MLARRFTIVCLMALVFGVSLSVLVANSSKPSRSWEAGVAVPCVFDQGITCQSPVRR